LADIPAWIAAIGTVGTLSTGLILFANTISDRRREYAKLVAAWTDFGKIDKETLRHSSIEGLRLGNKKIGPTSTFSGVAIGKIERFHITEESVGFRLNLKNNGLQPVYGCVLFAFMNQRELPPGNYPLLFDNLKVELGIIAPGKEVSHSLLIGAPNEDEGFPEALVKALTFRLEFTDASGRRWVRNEAGQLKALGHWPKAPWAPHHPGPVIAGSYTGIPSTPVDIADQPGAGVISGVKIRLEDHPGEGANVPEL
jgi:hypothetical protein